MLVIVSLFYISSATAFENVILRDSLKNIAIGKILREYEDTTGSLPFLKVSHQDLQKKFIPVNKAIPSKGHSRSAFWYQFPLRDSSSSPQEWILEIAMPNLHQVDFFIISSGIIDSASSGITVTKQHRQAQFRNPCIEFKGSPGKEKFVYFRIESESKIIAPVFLWKKKNYIEHDRNRDFIHGLYFGAVFMLALFHFYLFLSTRDRGYLLLALFAITFALNQMIVGYGYILWGLNSPGLLLKYVQMLNFVPIFFAIILSRFFIQSKVYSVGFDHFLRVFQISALVLIPASLLLNFTLADQIFFIIKIAPIPFYIGAAITAHRKGNKQALHYLIASSSFLAGIIIYNLMYGFSILPFNTFTYYIPNITIIITLSLYSITLADKINIYKAEREQARIRVLNELNAKLRAQEALAVSERDLEQSRKMEVVGRLLSGIAHDINNFLNPILGYSLLIKKQCQNNPKLVSLADRLSHATSQLRELATSLLGITRKGRCEKTIKIDLSADIEQACSLLKHSVKKDITVIVDRVEDNLFVSGDRGMIHNAIINVCMNAVDAIRDCGSITISTCNCYLDSSHPSVRKFGIASGQYAAVSVCDTGSGMVPEVLDHIFEPYFTTKESGKGTGLGLSNVYNCMKVHDGCIEVVSEAGHGSTFILYFPLIPEVITDKDDSYKVRSGSIIDAVIVDGNPVSLT